MKLYVYVHYSKSLPGGRWAMHFSCISGTARDLGWEAAGQAGADTQSQVRLRWGAVVSGEQRCEQADMWLDWKGLNQWVWAKK